MRLHDEAEYKQVVVARAHALRRTAYVMCGDWHLAEDLVQTVFIKLYQAWGRVERRDSLDGYLRTTLMRACIDASRRAHRREASYGELPDLPFEDGPGSGYEERQALLQALAVVPPKQRAVLVLRYWEDLSVEETAGVLGCSTGNVKSQASRGLATLRGSLARPTRVGD